MCPHLVHSECLRKAGQALNADGKRYGIGGFGARRAGCPVCSQPVTFWFSYDQAAAFPIFWMHRIQACLEKIRPWHGSVSAFRVQKMLKTDPHLTKKQKKYLVKDKNLGFPKALSDGGRVWLTEVRNGGPENGGSMHMGFEDGVWDFNEDQMTLWLHKWGPYRRLQIWIPALTIAVIAVIAGLWFQRSRE